MNRPLKRLNRNAHKHQPNINKLKKTFGGQSKPNFLDALSEYKKVRDMSRENVPSTSKGNQENVKAYQSVTVISDDDLEDGEIIEDPVLHYVSLIAQSFKEVERSKKIKDKKSPDSTQKNQPIFYVDKSAEGTKSEVPLYTSLSDVSAECMEVDDSVIIVNDTPPHSDDSVIIIDDKTPVKSNFSTGSDFIALSPIPHELQKSPENSGSKERRRERQKARLMVYKQKKMVEKVLELQSNGLLEGIAPIRVPLLSSTIISHETQKPETSNTSTSQNLQAIPKPVPFTSQNIPATTATPSTSAKNREKRIILIDGSNVAMGFTASQVGKKAMVNDSKEFSVEALKKVITYFESKEFQVKAVVPEYRVRRDKSSNHPLMKELQEENKLVTTPSKSYDDLILLESAAKLDAAIVSNDLFRDVRNTKKESKEVIEVIDKRQIRYNWVFGELILAEDPYGKLGPKLDDILFKNS